MQGCFSLEFDVHIMLLHARFILCSALDYLRLQTYYLKCDRYYFLALEIIWFELGNRYINQISTIRSNIDFRYIIEIVELLILHIHQNVARFMHPLKMQYSYLLKCNIANNANEMGY